MRWAWLMLLAWPALAEEVCARPAVGSAVQPPPELRSSGGELRASFSLRGDTDAYGLARYCYVYGDRLESPTLRVKPGDWLVLELRNELRPEAGGGSHAGHVKAPECRAGAMTASASNLHFHGMGVPPECHQDDVMRTLVQAGDAPFEYRVQIPASQPPGLYWYHPHVHGFSERQVQGGASGALIVEGIERANPSLAGLPERVLVLRDQPVDTMGEAGELGDTGEGQWRPALDASINRVPLLFLHFRPAEMAVPPETKELWRVLNASSDTFFDLQLMLWRPENPSVQPLQVVAVDGVPVGAGYAGEERKSLLIPPGGRAEFTVTTPPAGLHAQLVTKDYNNGPSGDRNNYRVLANLRSSATAPTMPALPVIAGGNTQRSFQSLAGLRAAARRRLYFSEKTSDPAHPKTSTQYFVTVEGDTPKVFDMRAAKPNLRVQQGTVEDWTIENRAPEAHVFHIHQLHFQVLERDGKRVDEEALRDTVELPFWDGKSAYPSIRVRMDFRDPAIVGTFPYHCHILEHEDNGMMGQIEVVSAAPKRAVRHEVK